MTARVISVNVGRITDVPWGRVKRSAIDKRPVLGPIAVHALGLGGDEIADLEHHGGIDQAVYAYAREDLDDWAAELGRDLADGQFGENLTTAGLDLQNARLGDRWRVGSALLEVCDVRTPCSVFQGFLGEPRWVRRFTEKGIPGAYLRVIEEGELAAGDRVVVEERREHDLTVALAFRAQMSDPDLLTRFSAESRVSQTLARLVDARRNEADR
jgi:MOSC domain-containing protein YiiM